MISLKRFDDLREELLNLNEETLSSCYRCQFSLQSLSLKPQQAFCFKLPILQVVVISFEGFLFLVQSQPFTICFIFQENVYCCRYDRFNYDNSSLLPPLVILTQLFAASLRSPNHLPWHNYFVCFFSKLPILSAFQHNTILSRC